MFYFPNLKHFCSLYLCLRVCESACMCVHTCMCFSPRAWLHMKVNVYFLFIFFPPPFLFLFLFSFFCSCLLFTSAPADLRSGACLVFLEVIYPRFCFSFFLLACLFSLCGESPFRGLSFRSLLSRVDVKGELESPAMSQGKPLSRPFHHHS